MLRRIFCLQLLAQIFKTPRRQFLSVIIINLLGKEPRDGARSPPEAKKIPFPEMYSIMKKPLLWSCLKLAVFTSLVPVFLARWRCNVIKKLAAHCLGPAAMGKTGNSEKCKIQLWGLDKTYGRCNYFYMCSRIVCCQWWPVMTLYSDFLVSFLAAPPWGGKQKKCVSLVGGGKKTGPLFARFLWRGLSVSYINKINGYGREIPRQIEIQLRRDILEKDGENYFYRFTLFPISDFIYAHSRLV